ncbi:hypothetical protein G7077_00515 [Sphingomonas piscis]|uniref:Phytoene synthase n=1 Tax=Sphingomonas piscis TaxID=2714943 RepID=A0A6G7YLN9_9SPHN|nr:hypothetical protein [Sphingomonas piscis]QIK77626.1 hypothetical protein G7077_00515 [Sphingomonas piscis]
MFNIDDAMADVVLKARDPALAAIKLAWWREQLQALDVTPPPAEPRLRAVSDHLIRNGVSGEQVSALEDGWLGVLHRDFDSASARGLILFGLLAQLLGEQKTEFQDLGRAWARADLARRTGETEWLRQGERTRVRVRRRMRPLTALAALALRDEERGFPLEPERTPGRSWALLRHRVSGRL